MREYKERRLLMSEQLNHELTCTVCVEYFDGPILLPCSHSFCKKCIQNIILHNNYPVRSFDCPLCRKRIFLKTPNTIDDFPKNLALENLVKLHTETENIFPDEVFEAVLPKLRFDKMCTNHLQPLCLFCESCSKTACAGCFREESCLQHRSKPLEDVCIELLERVNTKLVGLKEHHGNLVEKHHKLKSYCHDIDKHEQCLKSGLESECGALVSQLNKKYAELKSNIQFRCAVFKRVWIAEKERCTSTYSQIEEAVDVFTRAMKETRGNRVFKLLNDCDSKLKPLRFLSNGGVPFLDLPTWNTQHGVQEAIRQITLKQVTEVESVTTGTQTPAQYLFSSVASFKFDSKSSSTRSKNPAFGNTIFPFVPQLGTEHNPTRLQSITAMEVYENKCFEELRWEYVSSKGESAEIRGSWASSTPTSQNSLFMFGASRQSPNVRTNVQYFRNSLEWPQQASGSFSWTNPLCSRSKKAFSFEHRSRQAVASVSGNQQLMKILSPSLHASIFSFVGEAATSKKDAGVSTSSRALVATTSTTAAATTSRRSIYISQSSVPTLRSVTLATTSTTAAATTSRRSIDISQSIVPTLRSVTLDTCLNSGGASTNSAPSACGLLGALIPTTTSIIINTTETYEVLGACGVSSLGLNASSASADVRRLCVATSVTSSSTSAVLSTITANIEKINIAQTTSPTVFVAPPTSNNADSASMINSEILDQALESVSLNMFPCPSPSMSSCNLGGTPVTHEEHSNSEVCDVEMSSQRLSEGSASSGAESVSLATSVTFLKPVPSILTSSSGIENLPLTLKLTSPIDCVPSSQRMSTSLITPVTYTAINGNNSRVESFSSSSSVTSLDTEPADVASSTSLITPVTYTAINGNNSRVESFSSSSSVTSLDTEPADVASSTSLITPVTYTAINANNSRVESFSSSSRVTSLDTEPADVASSTSLITPVTYTAINGNNSRVESFSSSSPVTSLDTEPADVASSTSLITPVTYTAINGNISRVESFSSSSSVTSLDTEPRSNVTKQHAETLKSFSPNCFPFPPSKMTNSGTPDTASVCDVVSSPASSTNSASANVESFSLNTSASSASLPSSLTAINGTKSKTQILKAFSPTYFVTSPQSTPKALNNNSNIDMLGACAVSSRTFVSPSQFMFTSKITNGVTPVTHAAVNTNISCAESLSLAISVKPSSASASTLITSNGTKNVAHTLKLTLPKVFMAPSQNSSLNQIANNGPPVISAAVDACSAACVASNQGPPRTNSTSSTLTLADTNKICWTTGLSAFGTRLSNSYSCLASPTLPMSESSKAVTTPVTNITHFSSPLYPVTFTNITPCTNPTQSNFRPITFVPPVNSLMRLTTTTVDVPYSVSITTASEMRRDFRRKMKRATRRHSTFHKSK